MIPEWSQTNKQLPVFHYINGASKCCRASQDCSQQEQATVTAARVKATTKSAEGAAVKATAVTSQLGTSAREQLNYWLTPVATWIPHCYQLSW